MKRYLNLDGKINAVLRFSDGKCPVRGGAA